MNAVQSLKKLLGLKPRISREQAMAAFTRRYASFKELLQANADLAGIMASLNAAQRGERSLETSQVRKEARRAIVQSGPGRPGQHPRSHGQGGTAHCGRARSRRGGRSPAPRLG